MDSPLQETQYKDFIRDIKNKVRSSQYSALRAVNNKLIQLYWEIGKAIHERQEEQGWGKSVVTFLARELQLEFPSVQGFSERNLWRMRNFYLAYKDNQKLPQLVAEIGWSHNTVILERCKDSLEREYYIQMVRKFGWTRNVLEYNIDIRSYENFLINQTNFDKTVEEKYKKQAKLAVKDEYSFGFLELGEEHSEREIERGLMENIRKFLIEMGGYFTFVGSQYRVEINEEEFFIDLLLYHRKLRCLVAIELKNDKFRPAYAGQLNFYLTALDELVRLDGENPSIGILICRTKDRTVVEYTLRDINKPMGIATYNTGKSLPRDIKGLLPTPEEIAHHLKVFEENK